MVKYSDFGVTYINDNLCAFLVAGGGDCKRVLTIKYPINMKEGYV